MTARHHTMRRSYALLIAAGILALAGCGHFLVPTAFRPVNVEDQIKQGAQTTMEVHDDGSVVWIQGRLEVSVRPMTDEELNRQFASFSDDGPGPGYMLPTNVYTYGNWKDPVTGKSPSRFSVFRVDVKNYEYPKVKFDVLATSIEADNQRIYYPWGQYDFEEYFRRFPRAYNGLGYMRYRERQSQLKRTLYPDDAFCFSGQELSGYIVFEDVHTDVREIIFKIPRFGLRYDFRNEPLETVDLSFRFERDLLKVSRRDQIAQAE